MSLTRRAILAKLGGAALVLGGATLPAFARKAYWYQKRNVVIGGYDPVAYFVEGAPRKGDAAHRMAYKDGVFYFASPENKRLFAENPEKYAPKYGGYCSYAVANNYTASVSPKAWTIHEGRLYLNYSIGVRRRFLKDVPGYIRKADQNWPKVLG